MRKFIFVVNAIEVVKILKAGRKLQGTLEYDKKLKMLVYTPNKPPRPRRKDEVIGHTMLGYISKTFKKYHWHEKLPTELDANHLANIMERDCEQAKTIIAFDQLMDQV